MVEAFGLNIGLGLGLFRQFLNWMLILIGLGFLAFLGYWTIIRPKLFPLDVDLFYKMGEDNLLADKDIGRVVNKKGVTFTKLGSRRNSKLILPPINFNHATITTKGRKRVAFYAADEHGRNWKQGVVKYKDRDNLEIEPVPEDARSWGAMQLQLEFNKFKKEGLLQQLAPFLALGSGVVIFIFTLVFTYDFALENTASLSGQTERLLQLERDQLELRDNQLRIADRMMTYLEGEGVQAVGSPEQQAEQVETFVDNVENKVGG